MFLVVWSSVVHVLWCYPGSVAYNSPTLSLLVPGLLSLPELLRLSPLHSFNFDFKVSIFDSFFFSYFNWSVLFSGDGHINEQAAFFMSALDYNVWSVGFISQSVCIGISHKIVILSFSVAVWGSFLFVYIHLFFCNWLLELCSPYSPIFAHFWTYLKVVCEMWLQFVLYFL